MNQIIDLYIIITQYFDVHSFESRDASKGNPKNLSIDADHKTDSKETTFGSFTGGIYQLLILYICLYLY